MRARHARLIMSNQIPFDWNDTHPPSSHLPYCIWSPDVAEESTYREVARRCPALRYAVGRACAVGGYATLYHQLNLRPDVSIAEEARESRHRGSQEIFHCIMASPVRYAILDDLDRSVHPNTQTPAYLNGDRVIAWQLDHLRFAVPTRAFEEALPLYLDIEEDRGIDGETSEIPPKRQELTYDEARLLFTPLPADLPTVKKDVPIQMAAYEGNIDRYARLMQPFMTEEEGCCVVRGIFHHTMFARWWADQLQHNRQRVPGDGYGSQSREAFNSISHAILVRRVMINDIEGITNDTPNLPFMIWWPLRPREQTLLTLAERCPRMGNQIAIACIICDYESTYRQLRSRIRPHYQQWLAAKQGPNPFYREDLERRVATGVPELNREPFDVTRYEDNWSGETCDWLRADQEPTDTRIRWPLHPFLMAEGGVGSWPRSIIGWMQA